MRSLLQSLFCQQQSKTQPRSGRRPCMAERNNLWQRLTRLASAASKGNQHLGVLERLEPRLALDVGVQAYVTATDTIGGTRYPGRVFIASNNASDVYMQRVASEPRDLLVADNGSFLNNTVVNRINDYDSIFVTNGVRRTESVEASRWWLFGDNSTRLALENQDVVAGNWSGSYVIQIGTFPFINEVRYSDISGTIQYQQADGTTSEWTFTAWNGSEVVDNPANLFISSGPGYVSTETSQADRTTRPRPELRTGYIYPTSVSLVNRTGGSYLDINWSNTPVAPPEVRCDYIFNRFTNNFFEGWDAQTAIGTAANPSLIFDLPQSRSAVYDGDDNQVSLGLIPGSLTGFFNIGSLSGSVSTRLTESGETVLIINGTRAGGLDQRRIGSSNVNSGTTEGTGFSYVLASGDAGFHQVSLNLTRDESLDDFFRPEVPGDSISDQFFAGWNVTRGQSVGATVSYLVYARDPQANRVVFAPGLDFTNEVTVDLLTPGSTIDINSPIAVNITDGDIDLRATNVNINAPVETPDWLYVGRSQTHENQSRLLLPLETGVVVPNSDYDDGLIDTPTLNPSRRRSTIAKQVVAEALVSPDGEIRRLVVLPGDEGYGYDPDDPPFVYVGSPSPQAGTASVIALSGSVNRPRITAGGTKYENGATLTASLPEFGIVDSVGIVGGGNYLIEGQLPTTPPLVIIDPPDLLGESRIGFGRRAEAISTVDPSSGALTITVDDGGLNYERAPGARVATFFEAFFEDSVTNNDVLTLPDDFQDVAFLFPGMPVEIAGLDVGVEITAVDLDLRQVRLSGPVDVAEDTEVRFYLNRQYLDNKDAITPVGRVFGTIAFDRATFEVSHADGVLTGVQLLNAGSGYKAPPTLTLSANGATEASGAEVAVSFSGGIAEVAIGVPGSNYTDGELLPITVSGAGGTGGQVQFLVQNGQLTDGTVVSPGSGYQNLQNISDLAIPSPPPLSSDAAANRAEFRAIVESDGRVREFELIRTGGNYVDPPEVSVSAPLVPTDATASTRIEASQGVVKEILIDSPGLLYAWPPKVIIAPPPAGSGGVQARAQAFLNDFGQVERIELVDTGSGYASRPDIWIEPQSIQCVVESLQIGASLNAANYELYIGEEVATDKVPKGLINLSPESTFGGAQLKVATVQNEKTPATGTNLTINPGGQAINGGNISGMTVSGSGIPVGTTVSSYNAASNTITLSQSYTQYPNQVTIDQRGQNLFLEAASADVNFGGRVDILNQTYLLVSLSSQRDAAPYNFRTRAAGANVDTGRVSGNVVAITLGNDLVVPSAGGIVQNLVDLDLSATSLRLTAAESEENPRGPFPYEIRLREEDNLDIDAVVATSGDFSLAAQGNLNLNTAIDTYGGITLRGNTLEVTSRLATRGGVIDIEANDLRIANSLEVSSVAEDPNKTDIILSATEGEIFLQGNVSAVNKIELRQLSDASGETVVGQIYGPAEVRGRELLVSAEGNVELNTNVDVLRGSAGNLVRISERDSIHVANLQVLEGGKVVLEAYGTDLGAVGVNPVALKASIYEAGQVVVAAPNGSVDITVDSVTDVELGDLEELRAGGDIDGSLAAGSVTIRSRAGNIVVFDAPASGSGARRVGRATNKTLPLCSYVLSLDGATAAFLDGEGSLNDHLDRFDGEEGDFEVGDRVLVKNEVDDPNTDANEAQRNGVYVVRRVGGGVDGYRNWRMVRAEDSYRGEDLPPGSYVRLSGDEDDQADKFFWVSYVNELDASVMQTENNQLVLPDNFGQIGGIRLNQSVSGEGVSPGAVVTGIDYANGVVTLGLQNSFAGKLKKVGGVESLEFAESRPYLMEAVRNALNDGETVLVTGSHLNLGASIQEVPEGSGLLLNLSPNSIDLSGDTPQEGVDATVTIGFVTAPTGSRVLNPAVRTFLLEGQTTRSSSDSFRVSKQFTNFDALYVGQPIFGDGVLPDTRITRLNPADAEVFVTPGGLPEQLPIPSRFEQASRSQRFRSIVAEEGLDLPDFVQIDTFTFFNYDLMTQQVLQGELVKIKGQLFNGQEAVVRAFDSERGLLYLDANSLADPPPAEPGTVSLEIDGQEFTNLEALTTGIISNYDYLIFDDIDLLASPEVSDQAVGQGLASGSRVLQVIADPDNDYGLAEASDSGATIVILTPNALFSADDVQFVTFATGNRTFDGPTEAGRYKGVFSGDLLRVSPEASSLNTIEIGDPVSGQGIRPDTFVRGIDLDLGLISVDVGGVVDQSQVPFIEVLRDGVPTVLAVDVPSGKEAVIGTTIRGEFSGDRIYLAANAQDFNRIDIGDSVQGAGILAGSKITGLDSRTGLVGLTAGALNDPEAYIDEVGGQIILQSNIPIVRSSELPSPFAPRNFDTYLEMFADFSDYDRLHIGQSVHGLDESGEITFRRFVTGLDPARRLVGLSDDPLIDGSGVTAAVIFNRPSKISFGLTDGVGGREVAFAGSTFGAAPIEVLNPIAFAAKGFVKAQGETEVASGTEIELVGFSDWGRLEQLFRESELAGHVVAVSGNGVMPGTTLTDINIGSGQVSLSEGVDDQFRVGGGLNAELRLNFHSPNPRLTTRISTDQRSAGVDFVVATDGGTNNSASSLGKMIELSQENIAVSVTGEIQEQTLKFWDYLAGTIELEQELPNIVTNITIDGQVRYSSPNIVPPAVVAPITVNGSSIVRRADGEFLEVGETFDGFVFREGSDGAVLSNVTIGGFAEGSAVRVENASFISLDGLRVGVNAAGQRAVNRRGITISGGEAEFVTVSRSTLTGSGQAAIVVENGASDTRILGNTVGTDTGPNEVGVGLFSSGNAIGVRQVPDSTPEYVLGETSPLEGVPGRGLVTASGLDVGSIREGMVVFVSDTFGGTILQSELGDNIAKIAGVGTDNATLAVEVNSVADSIKARNNLVVSVGYLISGETQSDVLELPPSFPFDDLYVGQQISGQSDGIASGTVIKELRRGEGVEPSRIVLSQKIPSVGFMASDYRRVRFGSDADSVESLKNTFTNNRFGVVVGIGATASGTATQNRLQLDPGFDQWDALGEGIGVRGPGVQANTVINRVIRSAGIVELSEPLEKDLSGTAVSFDGADDNRLVNTNFERNLYSGIRVNGGKRHEIGGPAVEVTIRDVADEGLDEIELASYGTDSAIIDTDKKTLLMPANYGVRKDLLKVGDSAYGLGIPKGATIAEIGLSEPIGDDQESVQFVTSVTLNTTDDIDLEPGALVKVAFGLGIYIDSAEATKVRVGLGVSGSGVVDYTKVEGIFSPELGRPGAIILTSPNPAMSPLYANSQFLLDGDSLVFTDLGPDSNRFVGNEIYGIEVIDAAFRGWDDVSDVEDSIAASWLIAANYFGVTESNAADRNGLGASDSRILSMIGAVENLQRGFDRVDRYGNQHGPQYEVTDNPDPLENPPDPPPDETDPGVGDGSEDPYVPTDPRIPIIRF